MGLLTRTEAVISGGFCSQSMLISTSSESWPRVIVSLRRLSAIRMDDRRRLLAACVESIAHDGATTVIEAQLLRAIGDSIECPIPPIAA